MRITAKQTNQTKEKISKQMKMKRVFIYLLIFMLTDMASLCVALYIDDVCIKIKQNCTQFKGNCIASMNRTLLVTSNASFIVSICFVDWIDWVMRSNFTPIEWMFIIIMRSLFDIQFSVHANSVIYRIFWNFCFVLSFFNLLSAFFVPKIYYHLLDRHRWAQQCRYMLKSKPQHNYYIT